MERVQPAAGELHHYYNAAILSRALEERRAAGDLAGVEQLTQVAPIAWQHINFYGRYEFTSRVARLIWSGSSRRCFKARAVEAGRSRWRKQVSIR